MIFMSYYLSRFFPGSRAHSGFAYFLAPTGTKAGDTLYVKLPDEFDDGTLWGDSAAVSFNLHPFLIFTITIRDNCLLHPFLNI